jgi:tripartite ATP-independent transporter DctP family solute receptor
MGCALAAGLTTSVSADAKRFTLATANGPKDFGTLGVAHWQKLMKERSNGALDMDISTGGALGGDQQLLQQLGTNEIQLHVAGPVVLHKLLKEYQCMEAEFVYRDIDHGYKVWTGKLGEEVSKKLEEKYGISILGVGLRGARQMTANKPIKTPDDIKGVKIRVTNPLRAKVFEAFGALPAPLSFAELYGALRQGVFEAQENPIPTIWGSKLYEVQKTINLTGHVISYYVISGNKTFVDGLSDAHRKIFDETLKESMEWRAQRHGLVA